jgi:hypothetical protein
MNADRRRFWDEKVLRVRFDLPKQPSWELWDPLTEHEES